ncbi:tumor necrosis factor receptor superfamily member 10B-like [Neopsephotus bourkii]|uniref:tumor necrosis factor receptor superfamily member 10B-like n=1 Tax=Neopsephotus bourkii TaxID=309878 RepID=UPI002AA58DE6|nr:tumor necrosis factor receptor superfamily member 10B-like [Neopsephotus bourkii]
MGFPLQTFSFSMEITTLDGGSTLHLHGGEVWSLGPAALSHPLPLGLSAVGRALACLFLPLPHGFGVGFKAGFPRLFQQEVPLGTAASALHRRDKLDLFGAHRGEEEFYLVQNSNIYCRKCAAGTYVAEHCKEQNGFSKCLPCRDNEYIEYPNDLPVCFVCRTCREDEVELSPCRATQNTRCACRNGTFCSPEHPCEMCQKCQPRCPKGEVELAPCTSSSDRRCGPPTTTIPSLSTSSIVIISVMVTGLFVGLLCLWKYCCCHSTGDRRDLSGKPCNVMDHAAQLVCVSLWLQDYLLQRVIRFRSRNLGNQDNRLNEIFPQDPLLPSTPGPVTPSAPGAEVLVPGSSQPTGKPRKKLVPVEGAEPYTRLQSSFYTFAQKVPHDHWKRFGRALNLLENDIALAEKESGLEMLIEMLKKWQEKGTIDTSVNTLLDTLHHISLGGVAEDIAFKLVKEGSFQYEVS